MLPWRQRQLVMGGGAALAFVGLWLGHTLEYVRVWGSAGLSTELSGSVHAYMIPAAAGLALAAAAFSVRLWQAWAALGRRLDDAHLLVWNLFRGRRADVPAPLPGAAPSLWAGVTVAWPVLTLLQIALYLFQENVEAIAGGVQAPGLGAITGVHALAPLVHAGVALVLLTATAAVMRLLRRRATMIAAVEAVARALLRTLGTRAPRLDRPVSRYVRAPLELLGLQVRQRPPPALLSV